MSARDLGEPRPGLSLNNVSNGLMTQEEFDRVRAEFEEREEIEDGLGPVYNAQSCAECHQTPVTGGISQITELRAGKLVGGVFVEPAGSSLINDRAIDAALQEQVPEGYDVRTLRTSLNTLGNGYVAAIADTTLQQIASRQPSLLRGEIVMVPVLEAGGALRAGRFGWKCQHASLVSFSADAYVNEMGITSPLMPELSTFAASTAAPNPPPGPNRASDTPHIHAHPEICLLLDRPSR